MGRLEVAVIGSGIAGLTLSRELGQAGCDVHVFEKSRGTGGRTSTRRGDHVSFDHGAQYFTRREPGFAAQVEDWLSRGVAAKWNGTIVRLDGGDSSSVTERERFVGVPGMSSLARDLGRGATIHTGTRVERVSRDGRWRVAGANNVPLGAFDAVVVAVPAPQAKPLLSCFPAFAMRVSKVRMSCCHAVLAELDSVLGLPFDGAFVGGEVLSWAARNSSKPGRPESECWVLHSDVEWSSRHLDLSAPEVSGRLFRAFSDAVGAKLPEPRALQSHRWLYARADEALADAYLYEPSEGIGVCGDWLSGTRVEDAYNSGFQLAQAIRETLL